MAPGSLSHKYQELLRRKHGFSEEFVIITRAEDIVMIDQLGLAVSRIQRGCQTFRIDLFREAHLCQNPRFLKTSLAWSLEIAVLFVRCEVQFPA